jgi:hypothetical protein
LASLEAQAVNLVRHEINLSVSTDDPIWCVIQNIACILIWLRSQFCPFLKSEPDPVGDCALPNRGLPGVSRGILMTRRKSFPISGHSTRFKICASSSALKISWYDLFSQLIYAWSDAIIMSRTGAKWSACLRRINQRTW